MDSQAAGQAYFITNNDPRPMWEFLGDLLEPLGYGRPRIRLPWLPLFLLALFMEWVVQPLLRPLVTLPQSEFTSFRIRVVSASRVLNCSKAKRELGYEPRVSIRDGVARTVAHFQPLSAGFDAKKRS